MSESSQRLVVGPDGRLVLSEAEQESDAERLAKEAVRETLISLAPKIKETYLTNKSELISRIKMEGEILRKAGTLLSNVFDTFQPVFAENNIDVDTFADFRSKVTNILLPLRTELSERAFSADLVAALTKVQEIDQEDASGFITSVIEITTACQRINLEADLFDAEQIVDQIFGNQPTATEISPEAITSLKDIYSHGSLTMTSEPFAHSKRFQWGLTIKNGVLEFHIMDLSVQRMHRSHLNSNYGVLRPTNYLVTIIQSLLNEYLSSEKKNT